MIRTLLSATLLLTMMQPAYAASFINGNFETGDATGWTTGSGSRVSEFNSTLTPADLLPGGSLHSPGLVHSGIVSPGLVPETGNNLNQVYSGNFSWRVEDTVNGGYGSAIEQTVNNYTDSDIFFAWAAVLEGAHGVLDAATVKIVLRDLTTATDIITREYNAASSGGGVDSRFVYNAPTNFYYTPWQIEQLPIDASLSGHNFLLSILAADCQPAGHEGFLFLDGFGAIAPPPVNGDPVPEPATLLLLGTGLLGAARARWRKAQA